MLIGFANVKKMKRYYSRVEGCPGKGLNISHLCGLRSSSISAEYKYVGLHYNFDDPNYIFSLLSLF
jgi:hypothetical protein